MPTGLIFAKYNVRSGLEIKVKFPEDISELSDKTLMHVINLHGFTKEAGIASLNIEAINFITYYSGSDTDYFLILILNTHEDPDDYEEVFEKGSKEILKNLEDNKYIKLIPTLYKQILESSLTE
ncbi:MAG TPA: hypothetical protein ENH75_10070 [archaeon]|nr:hypothetical protein [archaeon]